MEEKSAQLQLRGKGWLANMADPVQTEFLSRGRLREFRAGDYAYHVGDAPGGIFGIVDGCFGVVLTSGDETAMCHLLRPGDWFGSGPVLSPGPRILTFQAIEPSTALVVGLADLNALGARFPELYRLIGALSARNTEVTAARVIGDLLITSGRRRLAAVLLRLCGVWEGLPPAPIPMSQQAIGQISNLSRERVNGFLREFEMAGCIELRYGSGVVTDPEVLGAASRPGFASASRGRRRASRS